MKTHIPRCVLTSAEDWGGVAELFIYVCRPIASEEVIPGSSKGTYLRVKNTFSCGRVFGREIT